MTKPATGHFSSLRLDQSGFTSGFGIHGTKRFNSPVTDDNLKSFKTKLLVEARLILMNIEQISR